MTGRLLSAVLLSVVALSLAVACDDDSPLDPTCTYVLSTTSATVAANGGTGSVAVTTGASCPWTATSAAGWLTITGGANGTGSGTVTFAASANDVTAPRTGLLTVADQTVTVTQDAAVPCTYTVAPTRVELDERGGTGQVSVAAGDGCFWTAVSADAWVEITSGAEGTGNGTVAFAAAANPAPDPRQGGLTVAGQHVDVEQAPDLSLCQYSVAPVAFDVCMNVPAAVASIVDTTAACPWTAEPGSSWLTVVDGVSGVGPGTVSFIISDNYDPPRSGVVMVRWPAPTAGQNLQVSQAGCYYGVSRDEIVLPAAGGTASFDVVQQSDPIVCGGPLQDRCVWTAATTNPWITITGSMPRIGDDRVSFAVAANTGAPRVGTIVVRDRTVRIVQGGAFAGKQRP